MPFLGQYPPGETSVDLLPRAFADVCRTWLALAGVALAENMPAPPPRCLSSPTCSPVIRNHRSLLPPPPSPSIPPYGIFHALRNNHRLDIWLGTWGCFLDAEVFVSSCPRSHEYLRILRFPGPRICEKWQIPKFLSLRILNFFNICILDIM